MNDAERRVTALAGASPAVARSAAYVALAAIFRLPEESAEPPQPADELLAALEALDDGLTQTWRAARWLGQRDATSRESLTRAYHRLFVGPLPPLAHPYESVYRTPDGRLMGEVAMQVIEAYAGAGLTLPDDSRDLPDHVAVELEFMAYLAAEEAAARAEGDMALAIAHLQRQAAFLHNHLTLWIPYFCHRVIEADRDGYYGQAAITLAAFVVRDLEIVAEGIQQLAPRPAAPATSPTHSAEAGRWEVAFHPERGAMFPCTLCGICAEVCRPAALRLDKTEGELTLFFDPARCDGCDYCRKYCPERILLVEPAASSAPEAAETRAARQLAASPIARCVKCGEPLVAPIPISEIGLRRILERFRRMKGDPKDEAAMLLCHACKLGAAVAV